MWSSERFFEKSFTTNLNFLDVNDQKTQFTIRKLDPRIYKLDYIEKDFSINFLEFFLKKKFNLIKFNSLKKNSEKILFNKFVFPLDRFFFIFFKCCFIKLICKKKFNILDIKKYIIQNIKFFFYKLINKFDKSINNSRQFILSIIKLNSFFFEHIFMIY